ncbi:GNAT family N-acetyltransferase [Nonomuraea sp. FMUSA5-5]|uniref:GNAT family N-acetyltransferase n=1 Tax=Nonomuraea composti TaxID=2720023 RepID=A0ABX1BEM5_9ACTN|nr:GNAT family N-acetyltransferase [Nonomuraea sp. FMUSA5-5]NJP93588.1 GNAT family N-acetyltransferase [Nonomuraea sp. FMUSA5-5]
MYALRPATPADYDAIAAVIDGWWGRPILPALPRLFLDHFHGTSQVAETADGTLVGFLIGILSPSLPGEAYIHFVGVCPDARKSGLARTMYERFFDLARADGRRVVKAVTAPVNTASIAFHRRMGFEAGDPVPGYNGPGTSLVTFTRPL